MNCCSTCGSKLRQHARFCQACGAATIQGLLGESAIPVSPAAPKGKFSRSKLMVVGVSVLALTGTVAAAASALTGG